MNPHPLNTVPEEGEDEDVPIAHSSAVQYDSDCSFYTDNTVSSIHGPDTHSSQSSVHQPPVQPAPYTRHHGVFSVYKTQHGPVIPIKPATEKTDSNGFEAPPIYAPSTNQAYQPDDNPNQGYKPDDPNHNHVTDNPGYPCAQYYLPVGRGLQQQGRTPSVPSLPYGMDSQTLDDSSIAAHEKTYFYNEPPLETSMFDEPPGCGNENTDRGNWGGRFEFILSSIGMAVGLGNIWRFPYLCYKNGGGAFFIPYLLMLFFVGMPLFFLETSLGQFSSNGPLTCWKFASIFKGVGIAQLIANGLVSIYYNMIMAWSLFYLVASFTSTLPWSGCNNRWNSPGCRYLIPSTVCDESLGFVRQYNGTCTNSSGVVGVWNYTVFNTVTGVKRVLPSEDYFSNRVLQLSGGIQSSGSVSWELVIALLTAWAVTFFCTFKGIKTSGKVVYFTVLFPYLVLFILLVRGATLPNAGQGIAYLLTPQWYRLGDAKVWYDAAVQIFFSVGLSYGSIIALSSYNKFHSNCLRNTLIVTIVNSLTSVFASMALFCYLGYLSAELKEDISEVATEGPGLAFVVFPYAATLLPGSAFWAVLFFLMILTLGLDSQFAALEMIVTSIVDQIPKWRPHKLKINLAIHVFLFLLGLPLCSASGVYWLQLMDTYCGGWALMIIGLLECVAIGWVYGSLRFIEDINIMAGRKPSVWWRFCWQISAPLLIMFIIIFSWADYSGATYGTDYTFPDWANALGWLMSLCSVIWIPVVAIYKICKEEGSLSERMRYLTLPAEEWGPALVEHRRLVTYVDGFITDPWSNKGTKKEKSGFENWGMPYALSASHDTISTISVGEQRWQRQGNGEPIVSSLGSIEYLPTHGSNMGSLVSIGQVSTVSFESGV